MTDGLFEDELLKIKLPLILDNHNNFFLNNNNNQCND